MVEAWKYENEKCRLNDGKSGGFRFVLAVVREDICGKLIHIIHKYFDNGRYKFIVKVAAYDNSLLEKQYHAVADKNKSLYPAYQKKNLNFYGRVIFRASTIDEIEKIILQWLNYVNITVSICMVQKSGAEEFLANQNKAAKTQVKSHPPQGAELVAFLSGGFIDRIKYYYQERNQELKDEVLDFYGDLMVKYGFKE